MRGLLFVSLAVAALAVVQVSAASDSWTDPAGDSNGAPDIRSLYLQDNWIACETQSGLPRGIDHCGGNLIVERTTEVVSRRKVKTT